MSVSVQISAISIVLDPLAQSHVGRDNKDIITETSMFNGWFRGSHNATSINRTLPRNSYGSD
jgi:hypothetical protein